METNDVILERRSIRKYTDKKIDSKDLERILRAGIFAPSSINLQPWHFVVVETSKNMDRLKKITALSNKVFHNELEQRFPNNPEVITETQSFLSTLGGAQCAVIIFLNEKYSADEISVFQSIGACIQNMCLAAWDMGIGSCWITAVLRVKEEIEREFGNGFFELAALLTLGYPTVVPKAPLRKENRIDFI